MFAGVEPEKDEIFDGFEGLSLRNPSRSVDRTFVGSGAQEGPERHVQAPAVAWRILAPAAPPY